MRRTDLESLAARCVPGAGPVDIQLLGQGPVNATYRVVREGIAHALRVAAVKPGDSGVDAGVDREWEARVQAVAARAGLAPAVEYCDPERGILLSRWLEGRSLSELEVRHESTIRTFAALLRRVHALPIPEVSRRMNPRQWIDYYHHALERSTAPRAQGREALRAAADAHLDRLARLPAEGPVLCHSDLHTLNVLDCRPALKLLDWEYAHVSDPWWDLAGWSANNDFEDALRGQLLSNYTGRSPTPADAERLDALCWLYDYTCLLWSELCGGPESGGVPARARLLEARLRAGV
jgi:thiamine kinase-like enzyme